MEENISLSLMPTDSDTLMDTLAVGDMVAARSKSDFLYILESDDEFCLFSHSLHSHGGGRKNFKKDERSQAMVRNLANLAETLYQVEYGDDFDLISVMASAEQAIISMFPGDGQGEDEQIEFIVPEK